MRNILRFIYAVLLYVVLVVFTQPSYSSSIDDDYGDGKQFAEARIKVSGETEWLESKIHPKTFNIPSLVEGQADFGIMATLRSAVRSYVRDGNVSGIRVAFLMAYSAANLPDRSGDVLEAYGEQLYYLEDSLGDSNFALCLSKMRPEVQSAVFYLLFFSHWPPPGAEKDWEKSMGARWPHTFALARTVKRLKWPHDFE
jgi:hypothetical protein